MKRPAAGLKRPAASKRPAANDVVAYPAWLQCCWVTLKRFSHPSPHPKPQSPPQSPPPVPTPVPPKLDPKGYLYIERHMRGYNVAESLWNASPTPVPTLNPSPHPSPHPSPPQVRPYRIPLHRKTYAWLQCCWVTLKRFSHPSPHPKPQSPPQSPPS